MPNDELAFGSRGDRASAHRARGFHVIIVNDGKVLLMKNEDGLWEGLSGLLDDASAMIADAASDALREELGIASHEVDALREGEPFEHEDEDEGMIVTVHPMFAEIATNEVTLDAGSEEFAWVDPEEVRQYELAQDFDRVLDAFSI